MQGTNILNKDKYWDAYYQRSGEVGLFRPSQFAAFVLGELGESMEIFDIGCGAGRDAFFFAQAGHSVTGIDKSQTAIDGCLTRMKQYETLLGGQIRFIMAAVDDPNLMEHMPIQSDSIRRLIYSRFFLHAITAEEEMCFFRLAKSACKKNDLLALEFRTIRDAQQKKTTPNHYRRFLEPLKVVAACNEYGFQPIYFVEGFGFAKFGEDDAHVARCLCQKI